ncbi:MAG: hypothetical protein AAFY57_20040 [Cyanobacteria bacterium J06642_2]
MLATALLCILLVLLVMLVQWLYRRLSAVTCRGRRRATRRDEEEGHESVVSCFLQF